MDRLLRTLEKRKKKKSLITSDFFNFMGRRCPELGVHGYMRRRDCKLV